MNVCDTNNELPRINHLVISGGGLGGIVLYGAVKQSNLRGEWAIENIKSIDAVSAGTFIAILISLKYDWETIDNYIIKRPWHNIFKVEHIKPLKIFYDCGLFDKSVIHDILGPFFRGVNLSPNITMKELYDFTGIDLHFYSTNLYDDKLIDFNWADFPEMEVLDAVYRSSTVPILFIPHCDEKCFYMDGFLNVNFPSTQLLRRIGSDKNALGFQYKLAKKVKKITNMLDMIKKIIVNLFNHKHKHMKTMKYQYTGEFDIFSIYDMYYIVNNGGKRRDLIALGEELPSPFPAVAGASPPHLRDGCNKII